MTISSQTRKTGTFVGSGSTGPFAFAFKIFQPSDMLVVKVNTTTSVETTLTLTTDFTVSMNFDQDSNPGGNVTLVVALAVGNNMVMSSQIPYLQETDLTNQGGFYPEVITSSLDNLTIQTQQLKEEVDRSAKLPITSAQSADDLVADIVRIAASATNIDIVANNIASVNTDAAAIANINTVAGAVANVNLVGTNIASVNTNATNIANINTNATNIVSIQNASANAASAAASAVSAAASLATFQDTFLGAFATDPTLDPHGGPLTAGDLYFNTVSNRVLVYSGATWGYVALDPSVVVEKDSSTGSATLPAGTTGQRTASAINGMLRYNSTIAGFEGYVAGAWGGVGGAQANGAIYENAQSITTSYTLTTSKNGFSVGPITLGGGVVITVPSGSRWAVI